MVVGTIRRIERGPRGDRLVSFRDNILVLAVLSVKQDKPYTEQAIGLPAVSWQADDVLLWVTWGTR